ncbi:hypothetical protein OAE36_00040 [bacterium]|nr:hypothetical protein [bacterium]
MKKTKFSPSFLKFKGKSFIISRISRYCLFNLHLYGLLAFLTSTKLKSRRRSAKKVSKIKILAIYSPGGLEDLKAIANSDALIEFDIIIVDYRFFAQLFRSILGDVPHDYDIHYSREHPLRAKYLKRVTKLLKVIKKTFFDFQGIINFNFVYYYTRDIETASGTIGTKFITLMKECLRTKAYAESTIEVYSKNVETYRGDLVLVHNEQTKEIFLKSGLFTCPIIKSGQPRSDLLKNVSKSNSPVPSSNTLNIVYFMISSRAGLPYFSGCYSDTTHNRIKPREWKDINKRALNHIFSFMSENPQINLLIKGKPNLNYEDLTIPASLNDKVQIIDGNPSMSIFSNADLVLGFNSTCLVESHLASCHSASIELYDFDPDIIYDYILPLPKSIPRITQPDQLYKLLSSFVNGTLRPFTIDKHYVSSLLDNSKFDSGKRSAQHLYHLLSDE